ncbi:type II secretion system minor pseudopilin GspK [Bowmanella yangjiangensis]|uniref:Type II secretion system protein K n=1 Tax=Bowmanella yangjiangensis TaxID=2811230 RepID=A0ABS3CR77_9ALTE|nr:type II secretion system minor pseudopilin GspK [Bowmanella yangjiangensis]MBN7819165.1 type II secretion system minor pseudopilin GspK [Bowmanella yangjiangensis]
MPQFKQQGVALVLVLMIVALVSVLATQMGSRLQLQAKRAGNIKDSNQAYWNAIGAEQYAIKAISEQMQNANGVINLNQPWAASDIQFPLEGGSIEAKLSDMQSCFNINALQSSNNKRPLAEAFKRLLQSEEFEIPSYDVDVFSDSVLDWLDEDGNLSPFGAEDSDYEAMQPPYLPANGLMSDISELRMVNGANPKWLNKVLPMLCVIPGSMELKVNVNTLDESKAPLLHALLGNNISLQDAKGIISSRKPTGFERIEDFLNLPEITNLNMEDEQKAWFNVSTGYFLLHTRSRYNNASFTMSSLLKIGNSNEASVIRRQFGGFQ